jgi:hypothetical protein
MPVVMTVNDGALKVIKTFNRRAVRNRVVAAAYYHSMKDLLLKITPFSLPGNLLAQNENEDEIIKKE